MEDRINRNGEIGKMTHPKTSWQLWWKQMRPHTLTASFTPVLIGTALALPFGDIHVPLFLAMLLAALIIQAATNLFNEYYDYKRGLDTEESVGIGGATVHYGIHPKVILSLAIAFFAAAVPLGVYICLNSSWWVAVIGTCCMAVGYLYTGGPYPIAYTPLGELTSGTLMGIGLILIAFYIQTGTVTTVSVLISVPIAILIGCIMLSNNIRDREGDQAHGRRTLAILLGHDRAVTLLAGMFTVSYLWVVGLVVTGTVSPWLLLVLLSAPKAVKASKLFVGKTSPLQMMPAMKETAQTNTLFGMLMAAGLICAYFL